VSTQRIYNQYTT